MTDTFGTPAFLDAFRKPIPKYVVAGYGPVAVCPSGAATTTESAVESEAASRGPISGPLHNGTLAPSASKTYAQAFTGVRQDSGDPARFVNMVRAFYDREGITEQKTIVFSDSLDIENCLKYKAIAEAAGFKAVFGVGTFLTSKSLRPDGWCWSM